MIDWCVCLWLARLAGEEVEKGRAPDDDESFSFGRR